MSEFNQSKYINDFIKETYDIIKIQVPKGQKDIIKEQAKKKGFKSVNEYMKELIAQDMQEGETPDTHIPHNNVLVIGDNNKNVIVGDVKGNVNL